MVARILVWLLCLAATAAAGRDGLVLLESGVYSPIALGEIWHAISPASLSLIERYLPSSVWTGVLTPVLLWPAWAVLAGTALVLWLVASQRRRRKWRSGSFD